MLLARPFPRSVNRNGLSATTRPLFGRTMGKSLRSVSKLPAVLFTSPFRLSTSVSTFFLNSGQSCAILNTPAAHKIKGTTIIPRTARPTETHAGSTFIVSPVPILCHMPIHILARSSKSSPAWIFSECGVGYRMPGIRPSAPVKSERIYGVPRARRSIPVSKIARTCPVTSRYRASSSSPDIGCRSRRASGSSSAGFVEIAPPPVSV